MGTIAEELSCTGCYNAEQEIKKAQRDRAKSKGIPFDSPGYVSEVEDNLFQPLSNRARRVSMATEKCTPGVNGQQKWPRQLFMGNVLPPAVTGGKAERFR